MADLPLRDRVTIILALIGLAGLSWLYLYRQLSPMDGMAMPVAFSPWTGADFALNFVIWWVMMPGMMLPSATPMILTFATVNHRKRARGQPFVPTAVFTAGYLVAWGLFGIAATLADWGLEQGALVSPTTQRLSPTLGAAVVIIAGLYQLTPFKSQCLTHCRSPFDFVLNLWRDGSVGALRMGFEHGLYCLGCCWFRMALLFVTGMMSLLWMAAVTAFVLAEKLFPVGRGIARISGALMIAFGLYLFAGRSSRPIACCPRGFPRRAAAFAGLQLLYSIR
jgi:predicted metal-binding membrane protein